MQEKDAYYRQSEGGTVARRLPSKSSEYWGNQLDAARYPYRSLTSLKSYRNSDMGDCAAQLRFHQ
ncbi:hypothetical protein GCM10007086_27040 [Photobacterium aphoticum]|nr:hypothetical protein GCM10007086_27040 [Photobacterium aphoticum]